MTKATLNYIDTVLTNAGINYEYEEWTDEIVYPYFTGEYQEHPKTSEDGRYDNTFILNGFSRGSNGDLQNAKETIENLFTDCATILENGQGLSIEYAGSFPIPTDNDELKRIQINLSIQEWRFINA